MIAAREVLILYSDAGPGILSASLYLRDHLAQHFQTTLIAVEEREAISQVLAERPVRHVIAHDLEHETEFLSWLKGRFGVRLYYFIPGRATVLASDNYHIYDTTLSGSSSIVGTRPHVQWCFDLPSRFAAAVPLCERRVELLHLGRVHRHKIDPMLLNLLADRIHLYGPREKLDDCVDDDIDSLMKRVAYRGAVVERELVHQVLNGYRFFLLGSRREPFALAGLEATYCGCLPLVLASEGCDVPWMVPGTFRATAAIDLVCLYESLRAQPIEVLAAIRDAHTAAVREKVHRLSDFERIAALFTE